MYEFEFTHELGCHSSCKKNIFILTNTCSVQRNNLRNDLILAGDWLTCGFAVIENQNVMKFLLKLCSRLIIIVILKTVKEEDKISDHEMIL